MEMKIFGKVYQLPLWLEKTLNVLRKIGSVLKSIAKWIYRLRGFFMAIPVVLAALYLATKNMARLPDEVGINLIIGILKNHSNLTAQIIQCFFDCGIQIFHQNTAPIGHQDPVETLCQG